MTYSSVVAALVRRCLGCCAAVAILASNSTPAHADLVIDDFSAVGTPDPWAIVLTSISSKAVAETGLKNVLGGVRESEVEASLISSSESDSVRAAVIGGVFDYASSVGAAGRVSLLYTGLNNLPDSLKGRTGIALDFLDIDLASGDSLVITVTLSDGVHDASYTESVSGFVPTVLLDFDKFTGIGAVNLFSIASVRVDFLAPQGAEFLLDTIRSIPSASTTSLLGVAALLAGRSLRRR